MHIDWTTLLFEMINFVVLVLIAVRFIYRPIRRVLAERQADIVARTRACEEREAEAAAIRARFEAELNRIDELAARRVDEVLAEARAEAEQIIAKARASARAEIDKAHAELAAARRRTLERFDDEVLRIATDAAQKLIRELAEQEIGLAFARRAAHALVDAHADAPITGSVEVNHSPELDPDMLAELLQAELGRELELRLRADEALIGGVRLAAQGFEIEASAGASLEHWYQSLTRAAA